MNNDQWAGLSLVLFFLGVIVSHIAAVVAVVWGIWWFITWIF
jgi:hypothetical protein